MPITLLNYLHPDISFISHNKLTYSIACCRKKIKLNKTQKFLKNYSIAKYAKEYSTNL